MQFQRERDRQTDRQTDRDSEREREHKVLRGWERVGGHTN